MVSSSTTSYKCFNDFIFRVPYLANDDYENFESLFLDNFFREAISIASSDLYTIISKESTDIDSLPLKLRISLLKYLFRMCTRCSPFGLFSGTGKGQIAPQTEILIDDKKSFNAVTNLDLEFFKVLSNLIKESNVLVNSFLWYTNTSIFKFGDAYRYTEKITKNNNEKYILSEVGYGDHLENVIFLCKSGVTKQEIIDLLVGNEDVDDAMEADLYVQQLIDNQIIISELEVCITKGDNLQYYIDKLSGMDHSDARELSTFLIQIKNMLLLLNNTEIGSKVDSFNQIEVFLRKYHHFSFKPGKNYLQTNLFVQPLKSTINETILTMVEGGLRVLNMLTPLTVDFYLEDFKRKFFERYEYQEVPLIEALDPDIGIGYAEFSSNSIRINPLLEDIINFNGGTDSKPNFFGKVAMSSILHKKYSEFLKNQDLEIDLKDEDFKNLELSWENLPLTFTTGVEIFKAGNNGEPLIYIKFAGGYSSANVLGRFCLDSEDVLEVTRKIIAIEDSLIPGDSIIAEIAYLPESENGGNVLSRPSLRKYEIPILSTPSVSSEYKVDLLDLMLSVDFNNKLILRSKVLNKFIIPRNTTAHNFPNKTNPIYYFLSSMQGNGGLKLSLLLNWGDLNPINGYFPRVVYNKNVILSLAKWKIFSSEINFKENFVNQVDRLKKTKGIPDKVLIASSNESSLMIDFNSLHVYDILKSEFKNDSIILEEYLFDNIDPLIESKEGVFNNEIIFNFHKTKKNGDN